jgi:hypothetical protein
MNLTLGLRALALLAFVAASTIVISTPDLFGDASASQPASSILQSVVALSHG